MKAHWAWGAAVVVVLGVIIFTPIGVLTRVGDDTLIRAAFYSSVLFMIMYTFLAAWWRNPLGRMIFGLDFSVALALLGDILLQDFRVHLSEDALTRILFASLILIVLTIVSRGYLLGRLHSWKFRLPWKHPSPGQEP